MKHRNNYKVTDKIIFGSVSCLHFIQIPSKQLKKTQEHRKITAFIFTAGRVFASPVLMLTRVQCPSSVCLWHFSQDCEVTGNKSSSYYLKMAAKS